LHSVTVCVVFSFAKVQLPLYSRRLNLKQLLVITLTNNNLKVTLQLLVEFLIFETYTVTV